MDKTDSDGDILKVINSLECSNKQCLHCKDGIEAITSTIRSTLLEINEIQERNRERRHRELVVLFEKYSNNEEFKSSETLEDSNNKLSVKQLEYPQTSNPVKKSDVSKTQERKQSVDIMKRRVGFTAPHTEAIPSKKPTETLNNLKAEPNSCTNPIGILKVKSNQREELVAMREKMLAIQRQKMEDRERKKRENNDKNSSA